VLRRHGLRAKKGWGQCFLKDPGVARRIAAAAELQTEDLVVEIGAGLGALTVELAPRARRVIAIERDRDLIPLLEEEVAPFDNVEVQFADALSFPYSELEERPAVVGNVPYNISTPLLFKVLEQGPQIRTATLMLQREVAERVVAKPNTTRYGIPSVLTLQVAEASIRLKVPRTVFLPEPQVDSAVVHLKMRPAPLYDVEPAAFKDVVSAAFAQRRKVLRNALTSRFGRGPVDEALAYTGIDGNRRGETLDAGELAALTGALCRHRATGA
jgi:16S rRNA (adenine1518-N6/adenine1519-N6)-dimethyltransferase